MSIGLWYAFFTCKGPIIFNQYQKNDPNNTAKFLLRKKLKIWSTSQIDSRNSTFTRHWFGKKRDGCRNYMKKLWMCYLNRFLLHMAYTAWGPLTRKIDNRVLDSCKSFKQGSYEIFLQNNSVGLGLMRVPVICRLMAIKARLGKNVQIIAKIYTKY